MAASSTAGASSGSAGSPYGSSGQENSGKKRRFRDKELPAEGNRIMGREIGTAQTVTALRDIDPAQGTAVVEV